MKQTYITTNSLSPTPSTISTRSPTTAPTAAYALLDHQERERRVLSTAGYVIPGFEYTNYEEIHAVMEQRYNTVKHFVLPPTLPWTKIDSNGVSGMGMGIRQTIYCTNKLKQDKYYEALERFCKVIASVSESNIGSHFFWMNTKPNSRNKSREYAGGVETWYLRFRNKLFWSVFSFLAIP